MTLVYLIIQVKQNSASIEATTNQANVAGFNDLNMMLAQNPPLVATFEKGLQAPGSLTDEENLTFTWVMRAYANLYMNLYDQYRHGTCPEFLWQRHADELGTLLDQPGFQAFLEIDSSFMELADYVRSCGYARDHRTGTRLDV